MKMPLSVHVTTRSMDGVHMGLFYAQIQETLDHPEVLGSKA